MDDLRSEYDAHENRADYRWWGFEWAPTCETCGAWVPVDRMTLHSEWHRASDAGSRSE